MQKLGKLLLDIVDAKFKRCIMNGMDFTKTDICGCTFEECSLEGCRFSAGQETYLNISEDQKETIHWVQGGKKN